VRKPTKRGKLAASRSEDLSAENGRFDAAQYLAYLQSLAPNLEIGPADIERYKVFFLIRDFVSKFAFDADRAELSVSPDRAELEALAVCFRRYLKRTISLDEAFGQINATGKGRRGTREVVRVRDRQIHARALYKQFRSEKQPSKRAEANVARVLNCSESTAHTLIFRKRRIRSR
jgi:hypothetical protein